MFREIPEYSRFVATLFESLKLSCIFLKCYPNIWTFISLWLFHHIRCKMLITLPMHDVANAVTLHVCRL